MPSQVVKDSTIEGERGQPDEDQQREQRQADGDHQEEAVAAAGQEGEEGCEDTGGPFRPGQEVKKRERCDSIFSSVAVPSSGWPSHSVRPGMTTVEMKPGSLSRSANWRCAWWRR